MVKSFRELEEEKVRHFIVPYQYVKEVPNINSIHPLKQRKVYNLYKNILNDQFAKNVVKSVWIFGSSVNNCCNIDSDIDIMISLKRELTEEETCILNHIVSKSVGSNFDLVILEELDTNKQLYKNIMKNRRLIYECDA